MIVDTEKLRMFLARMTDRYNRELMESRTKAVEETERVWISYITYQERLDEQKEKTPPNP